MCTHQQTSTLVLTCCSFTSIVINIHIYFSYLCMFNSLCLVPQTRRKQAICTVTTLQTRRNNTNHLTRLGPNMGSGACTTYKIHKEHQARSRSCVKVASVSVSRKKEKRHRFYYVKYKWNFDIVKAGEKEE